MAQAATIRVKNLREVNGAFKEIDRKLATEFGSDMKKAGEPVAQEARRKVTRYQGASVSTIRVRRSGLRVFVEQGARKVTGKRGDFGALQMRTVLIPALDEHQEDVTRQVERVIDNYANRAGF